MRIMTRVRTIDDIDKYLQSLLLQLLFQTFKLSWQLSSFKSRSDDCDMTRTGGRHNQITACSLKESIELRLRKMELDKMT